jgi:HK97 family phage portal protein
MGILSFFGLEYRKKNVKFQDVDRTIAPNGLGAYYSASEVVVTAETAKKVSTFYSCVRNISEDIAKQQVKVLRVDSNGNRTIDNGHNVYKLLNLSPNAFCNPIAFWETIISEAIELGNGYAFIERDTNGYPIAIYNLDPKFVTPKLQNRKLYYIVNDQYLGIYGTFTSMDIFHLRGMGNGYVGISILKWASESVGKAISTQNFASKFFLGDAVTGILELTGVSDETKAQKIKEAFLNSYRKDGLGVIGGASKYTKMSFNADEMQMLEAQEFGVNDVCRWFRMPLTKVQKSEKTENIEALNIEYVNDCLSAWQTRIEQEVEAKLFDSREKQMYDVKHDNSDLLRGDTQAQERRIKTMFMIGAWNANKALQSVDENTIGDDGKKYFVPVNMMPTENVNEFWDGKSQSNMTESSADSSGSGATNNNISQNGK